MMNLDEEIKHCEEKAEELREKAKIYKGQIFWERDAEDCQECAEEHEQLAEWLMELKKLREQNKALLKQRPQGKWIKVTKAGTVPVEYICSLCRRKIYDNYELTTPIDEFYPFCHCGAEMKGGEEE